MDRKTAVSERMVGVESAVGSRIARAQPVATASAATTGFATAASRHGARPIAVRRMLTAAKPCDDRSWNTSYRRLPPSVACHAKSSFWHNA